ncbi:MULTISPECIES: hypothetical protein [Lactobacillales]|uniref:hypothetical protein n=1 Tax=Lactobacillales TaxID=186826 RepID=UPI000BA5AE42|nr:MULTISPECIES: hypothetical protein [Lactobacillales]PST73132.1 hypothetical protein AEH57_00465 [Lactococcus garvieae]EGO5177402.1 hypothetical protein [Enterococcus faecalis]EGO6003056.1 hypothetical protein [Enterococcus faecalis]EGO9051927.1 hypothetical protein [Enterococcus faecalis]MCO0817229.1 hypothetical protein [Lactococcus lactis]
MEKKTIILKAVHVIAYVACVILAVCFVRYVDSANKATDKKDQEIATLTKQNKALDSKYNELYEQKNGNANQQLVLATNGVFSSLFDYDTKKISIADRREKASQFTTDEALEAIFPKQKNAYNASVQTISKLKEQPQIFYAPTNDKTQKVLIIVENEVTIQGSDKIGAKFMYQAEFDPIANKFVSLKNAGTLNE